LPFLPQATENLPWGDDLCCKIGGKVFLAEGAKQSPSDREKGDGQG